MNSLQDDKKKLNITIFFIILATLFVTYIINNKGYMNKTTDRLYFSITEFGLPGNSATIGNNSDICYAGVPEKFMTVTYNNGKFFYEINRSDSCMYLKINGKNENLHEIDKKDTIYVLGLQLTGEAIFDMLKGFDNEHFMLKDVLIDKIDPDTLMAIENGDKYFETFIIREKKDKKLNEFIDKLRGKEKNEYSLIILDNTTKISGIGYKKSGEIDAKDGIKIQFFNMRKWTLKTENSFWDKILFWNKPKSYFTHNKVRYYFAKPAQMFTEWGAGHILIKGEENNLKIKFPKAITTTIPIEKFRDKEKIYETGIFLKQTLRSYPVPNDFYIPAFSDAMSEYVCELTEIIDNKIIFQDKSGRDTVIVNTEVDFFPKIEIKNNQNLEIGTINYKTKILNKNFYKVKHKALFRVMFILTIILFFSFPKSGDIYTKKYRATPLYICGMFVLFWFFLNQKLIIAEKLTFTYPYFEKMYPVTYLTTLFAIFALFLMICLVNKYYLTGENFKSQYRWRFIFACGDKLHCSTKYESTKFFYWGNIVISVIIFVFCLYVISKVKPYFLDPIWSSYREDDFFITIFSQKVLNPFSKAMNDNHFTVFFINGILLIPIMFLFCFNWKLIPKKIFFAVQKLKQIILTKFQNCKKIIKMITCLTSFIKKISFTIQKLKQIILTKFQNKKIITYVTIIILLIVSVGIVAVIPGNFSTVIAVLILLVLLSKTMHTLIEAYYNKSDFYKKWEWCIFGSTIFICCFVFIGMLGDFGFFIYLFGMLTTWILLVASAPKYDRAKGDGFESLFSKRMIKGIAAALVIAVPIVIFVLKNSSDPEQVDYGRNTRRIQNCIMPENVKKAGYSYSESDMQWMELLRWYAEKVKTGRGKNNDIYGEENSFHQLVDSGQSPVILNDVAVPVVYIGPLRGYAWFGLLFGIATMAFLVYFFTIGDTWRNLKIVKDGEKDDHFIITRRSVGRLLAANIWIFTTLYLFLSYYWGGFSVPFTGRLIPGYGIDAVGESLEIIILFTFMCALCKRK
ncbi:MAG: hypothetical protein FWH18_02520 [Marinilabiliaceae bacterium]|nr:hypothetical protein [Marinilabiliaceae bacterium]